MSLLTRCPACVTLFRVVPDQLRISDGWVKCGQCGEIFDASQHLVEEVGDPLPQSDAPLDTSPAVDAPAAQDSEDTQWMNSLSTLSAAGAQIDIEPDEAQPSEENPALVAQALAPDEATDEMTCGEQQTDGAPISDQTQLRWDDEPQAPHSEGTRLTAAITPEDTKVTFLAGAGYHSLWQKPVVRVVLMLIGLLLGLSLSGQWVYLERDRLAAQHPDLKPALQAFCGVTNCQVQALKRIESLSVDSVGFHLLGKDTYRLTFNIKNSSALPLALPDAELALTDASDQPVFRRVFSAQHLAAAQTHIVAGGEWPVTVALRVRPTVPEQRVLGYRLLIFYP